MGRSFVHERGISARDSGVWVSGEARIEGALIPVREFFDLEEYDALSSRRLVNREARTRAISRFHADMEPTGAKVIARSRVRPRSVIGALFAIVLAFASCEVCERCEKCQRPADAATVDESVIEGWDREFRDAWFITGCSGAPSDMALAFLSAEAERSTVGVCKAALWLSDPGAWQSNAIYLVAARHMLESFQHEEIVSAVRRDAHHFGMAPNEILSRLEGAGRK